MMRDPDEVDEIAEARAAELAWYADINGEGDEEVLVYEGSPGGPVICCVWYLGTDFDEDPPRNAIRNARLIAAAPKLLRGCQSALAYLVDPASRFPENREEAARIIRDAVCEATGQ